MNRYLFLLIFFLFLLTACKTVDKSSVVQKRTLIKSSLLVKASEVKIDKIILPDSFLLDVPFVPQAPFANWDVHGESCEEAGILLAHYYYLNQDLSKERADAELRGMIAYQEKNWGGQKDIYADGIAKLAHEYYGYEPRVLIADTEKMKNEIVIGNPVIVPTTALYLKPEKSDYPEVGYHVIDLIGFDQTGFISHDPGTYSGKNTHYRFETIEKAMQDYEDKVVVLK